MNGQIKQHPRAKELGIPAGVIPLIQNIMKTLEIKDGHKTFTIHDNGNEFLSMERREWNPYTQKAEYQTYDMRRSDLAKMLDVLANVNEEAV